MLSPKLIPSRNCLPMAFTAESKAYVKNPVRGHKVEKHHPEGSEPGAGTGVEANEGAQEGNEGGSGDGAGTGVETRGRTHDGNGDGSGDGNESSSGDGNGDEDNGNEDRIGSGRAEERRRSATNRVRVVDAVLEAGETWVERGKNVENKGLVQ